MNDGFAAKMKYLAVTLGYFLVVVFPLSVIAYMSGRPGVALTGLVLGVLASVGRTFYAVAKGHDLEEYYTTKGVYRVLKYLSPVYLVLVFWLGPDVVVSYRPLVLNDQGRVDTANPIGFPQELEVEKVFGRVKVVPESTGLVVLPHVFYARMPGCVVRTVDFAPGKVSFEWRPTMFSLLAYEFGLGSWNAAWNYPTPKTELVDDSAYLGFGLGTWAIILLVLSAVGMGLAGSLDRGVPRSLANAVGSVAIALLLVVLLIGAKNVFSDAWTDHKAEAKQEEAAAAVRADAARAKQATEATPTPKPEPVRRTKQRRSTRSTAQASADTAWCYNLRGEEARRTCLADQ